MYGTAAAAVEQSSLLIPTFSTATSGIKAECVQK